MRWCQPVQFSCVDIICAGLQTLSNRFRHSISRKRAAHRQSPSRTESGLDPFLSQSICHNVCRINQTRTCVCGLSRSDHTRVRGALGAATWPRVGAWVVLHSARRLTRVQRRAKQLSQGQPDSSASTEAPAPRHGHRVSSANGRWPGRFDDYAALRKCKAVSPMEVHLSATSARSIKCARHIHVHQGRSDVHTVSPIVKE